MQATRTQGRRRGAREVGPGPRRHKKQIGHGWTRVNQAQSVKLKGGIP